MTTTSLTDPGSDPSHDAWVEELHRLLRAPMSNEHADTELFAQVVFAPSFHPEVCTTLMIGAQNVSLLLQSMRTNLYYYESHRRHKRGGLQGLLYDPPAPPRPRYYEQRISVPKAGCAEVLAVLCAGVASPRPEADLTADGMSVYIWVKPAEGPLQVRFSTAHQDRSAHAYAEKMFRLFDEHLERRGSRKLLKNISAYLTAEAV